MVRLIVHCAVACGGSQEGLNASDGPGHCSSCLPCQLRLLRLYGPLDPHAPSLHLHTGLLFLHFARDRTSGCSCPQNPLLKAVPTLQAAKFFLDWRESGEKRRFDTRLISSAFGQASSAPRREYPPPPFRSPRPSPRFPLALVSEFRPPLALLHGCRLQFRTAVIHGPLPDVQFGRIHHRASPASQSLHSLRHSGARPSFRPLSRPSCRLRSSFPLLYPFWFV